MYAPNLSSIGVGGRGWVRLQPCHPDMLLTIWPHPQAPFLLWVGEREVRCDGGWRYASRHHTSHRAKIQPICDCCMVLTFSVFVLRTASCAGRQVTSSVVAELPQQLLRICRVHITWSPSTARGVVVVWDGDLLWLLHGFSAGRSDGTLRFRVVLLLLRFWAWIRRSSSRPIRSSFGVQNTESQSNVGKFVYHLKALVVVGILAPKFWKSDFRKMGFGQDFFSKIVIFLI